MSVCVTVCMRVSCLYEAVLALIMSTVHVYDLKLLHAISCQDYKVQWIIATSMR